MKRTLGPRSVIVKRPPFGGELRLVGIDRIAARLAGLRARITVLRPVRSRVPPRPWQAYFYSSHPSHEP